MTGSEHETFFWAIIRNGAEVPLSTGGLLKPRRVFLLLLCTAHIYISLLVNSHSRACTNQNGFRVFYGGILLAYFGGLSHFEWNAAIRFKNIYIFHYWLFSQSTKQKYKAIFFLTPIFPFFLPSLSSPVEFKLKKSENWSCCTQGDCNMHIWFLWWI